MKVSPGESANLRLGDLIVRINGTYVNEVYKVAKLAEEARDGKRRFT